MFGLKTHIKNKCLKEKLGTISQEDLNKKIEEIKLNTTAKDAEGNKLQMTIQQLSSEGSSVSKALRTENVELKKRIRLLDLMQR